MPYTECDGTTPQSIQDLLSEAGEKWANDPFRPKIDQNNLVKWDKFIDEWIKSPEVPLFVRKGIPRGQLITHQGSNRNILRVDNSPAQWIFKKASLGENPPPIQSVVAMLKNGQIPITFALGREERAHAHFFGLLGNQGVNTDGWKLAHIKQIGINNRAPLEMINITDIEAHFKKLMSPRNMFVVTQDMAGIAEDGSFIASFLKNSKNER